MRKVLLTTLLALTALLTLASPAVAPAAPARASTDDFSYESWDVRYDLSLDTEGRAVAHVTERLVARFPDFDQNRGIVRALPLRYEGAPAAPEQISVHDADGNAVPFETEEDDTFRAILVGGDDYVHGLQTYVIEYTLHDVVLAASETRVDEFYWDVVPLERRQNIDAFTATVRFDGALADHLTGAGACYHGPANDTARCELDGPSAVDGGSAFTVPAMALPAGSGVTLALALEPGTVVQPPQRIPNFGLDVAPALLAGGAAAVGIAGSVAVARMKRKRKTFRGTIVAQYDVPDHLPPLIAGPLTAATKSPVAAEFVHLAVGGATRIEETEGGTGIFGTGKPQPAFRLLDPSRAVDALDQKTVRELFPTLAPGAQTVLPKNSTSFGRRMQQLQAAGVAEAKTRGYFTKERSGTARVLGFVALGLLVPTAILLLMSAGREPSGLTFAAITLGGLGVVLGFMGLSKHQVYTPLGAETREYLEGVREFVRVAEADRLRVLQSYSGAERRDDGGVNVVHIYERLLPYAMLFGLEKEWGKVLEVAYHESGIVTPLWYPALGMHGLSGLDRTLSQFTSTLTSSAGYTSSSSGGSSGGGFSGGGGGGGFSGGR